MAVIRDIVLGSKPKATITSTPASGMSAMRAVNQPVTPVNPNIPAGWNVPGSAPTGAKWVNNLRIVPLGKVPGAVVTQTMPPNFRGISQQPKINNWNFQAQQPRSQLPLPVVQMPTPPGAMVTQTRPANFLQSEKPKITNWNWQTPQRVDLSQKWTQKQWADAYKKLLNAGKGMPQSAIDAWGNRMTGNAEWWLNQVNTLDSQGSENNVNSYSYAYPDDWGWYGGGGSGWDDWGNYTSSIRNWYNSLMNWRI